MFLVPMVDVVFHGTRGSFPVHSPYHFKYGGHTSCVSIITRKHWLILDAGTGMIDAGSIAQQHKFQMCHLFLTHLHLDHIVGLPAFSPLWSTNFTLNIYSCAVNPAQQISTLISPPYFPVHWKDIPATPNLTTFNAGETLTTDQGYVDTITLSHPGGGCGYRLRFEDYKICYITDTDLPKPLRVKLIKFVQGCDLLIFDSTYCDSEYGPVADFGHSTWQMACDLAKEANVKRLALFHHAPNHTDDFIDALEVAAKKVFPRAFAARCGQTLTLPE